MNIYVTDERARVCAQYVTDYNWAGRAQDAMELVAAGLARWEGESCEVEVSEVGHSYVKWVERERRNWEWVIEYTYWLIRELGRRGKHVPIWYSAMMDYVVGEYGGGNVAWEHAPPRCVPKAHKSGNNSNHSVVEAYRSYIVSSEKLWSMGDRVPPWLNEE